MNIKPLSVHAGLATLPLILMGVGVAATCLVAWQVASSEGGASALTWVGLGGIVASVLAAGAVALQSAGVTPVADSEQIDEVALDARSGVAPEVAEPPIAEPIATAVESQQSAAPDTALLEELESLRDQLMVAESTAEQRQAALSEAEIHRATFRESAGQALASLARLRESLGVVAVGAGVAEADASAPTAVIASNSREVLDGIDSALATMQQQASASAQRLERVGESAAESVALLTELLSYTEQTEILSVNAAIQATLAGETGNGFAVIAEQLQRVTSRSDDVCGRLETLGNLVSNDVVEALSDNKERNAELARSKRLSGDLRTGLVELSKSATTAGAADHADDAGDDVTPLIDAAEQQLTAALAAIDAGVDR